MLNNGSSWGLSRRSLLRYAAGGASLAALASVMDVAAQDSVQTGYTLTMPMVTTFDITLDPNKAENLGEHAELYMYIYGGMVVDDKDAHVLKDLAESIETSPDGLVYTFHIRPDAKFGSGRAVVADDFIYSWKRSLDPERPSPTAHFLENLQGYEEYSSGEATEISGVTKIDDQTLQLTLSRPYNYFLSYMCIFSWYVVDRELVEQYGDSNNSEWTNHQPYGTGMWKVDKFDPTTGIELVPNEHHWAPPSPSISRIVIPNSERPHRSQYRPQPI